MFVKETTLFYHKFENFKRIRRILLGRSLTVKNYWGLLTCDQSVVSHKSSTNKDHFSHINSEETIENEPYPKFILG